MNRDKLIELSYLYLLEELDDRSKVEFENALMQDDELKSEFENIKESVNTIRESKPALVSEQLLVNARQDLMREIRKQAVLELDNESIADRIKKYFFMNRRYVLGGLATFVFGVIFCYMLLVPRFNRQANQLAIEPADKNDLKISNLQVTRPDSLSGDVEVKFDLTKPVKYRMKNESLATPNMLIASILGESNPGIRIRSVNTLAEKIKSEEFKLDRKIKEALITSMKKDNNPVVRKSALNVLSSYPLDEEIRDAFLFVLSNDRNSGMRVAAINSLADFKHKGQSFDEVIRKALNNKAATDENKFIRLRAASILQEAY
jgi:hypothetical protein